MRFGLITPAAPGGSVANSWSIPKFQPIKCSLNVSAPEEQHHRGAYSPRPAPSPPGLRRDQQHQARAGQQQPQGRVGLHVDRAG